MLSKVLQSIGLSQSEAKVYLAVLKLGTQDLASLSKEVGFSKYNTSLLLTNLMERGFVTKFTKNKDYFAPQPPDDVLNILEQDKSKMEEGIEAFETNMQQFKDYMNPDFAKPEIAFYEGKDGVVAAYEDTLTSKTDILAIASVDDTELIFPKYVPEYYRRRKAAGILIKAIFPDSKMSRERQKRDKDELRISRLVPKDLGDFHIEMNIYDDKVAYFSVSEKLAIIVQSKVIADSMRSVFEIAWRVAEVYDENLALKRVFKNSKKGKNLGFDIT